MVKEFIHDLDIYNAYDTPAPVITIEAIAKLREKAIKNNDTFLLFCVSNLVNSRYGKYATNPLIDGACADDRIPLTSAYITSL